MAATIPVGNQAKSSNKKETKQAKAQAKAVNESDNGKEEPENTNETEQGQKPDEQPQAKAPENPEPENTKDNGITPEPGQVAGGGTAVVEYIGNGIWIDKENKKWSKESVDGTNILSERKYPAQVYESRGDLKFMVNYGAMKVTIV